jgi:GxxExxY protein
MDEILIECIRCVENELSNYYKENIYQNSLYIELNVRGYLVQTEVIVPVFYKNVYVGFERADIVVFDKSGNIIKVLELKSQTSRIGTKEINQLRKYLINLNCESGILVNFYDKLEIIKVTKTSHEKISNDTLLRRN